MLSEAQEFLHARNSEFGGGGTGFDGFIGSFEIVPGQRIDVGANDQVGVTLPGIELMFLCGADGASNDLEHIPGRLAMTVVDADGNSDDDSAAEFPRGLRGNGSDQGAIGKAASADLDWFEQARKSATGANGFDQRALTEYDRIATGEISSNDRQRNFHVCKIFGLEYAFNQVSEAMIASQAEARNAPAGDVAETDGAAGGDDSCQRRSAGVGGSEDAADAGARYVRYGDVILLEDLQHAKMRETASEPATQRQSDAWAGRDLRFSELKPAFHHEASFAIATESGQWAARSEIPVLMYSLKFCPVTVALSANSTKIPVPYPRCTIGARGRRAHSHSRSNAVL
jgi:hypothetical protein